MPLNGMSIIAGEFVPGTGGSIRSVNPATGEELQPSYGFVGVAEVDDAAQAATAAFEEYRATTPRVRAGFLRRIADRLEELKDEIVDRATQETGLPAARVTGEHARTVGQLRAFADEVLLGEHQGVRIDDAQPDRSPAPKPDVRQRQIPIGPVVVFGASNFPLAFSTAGGDTASALAAGCPVIVKAHNAHPGTAELAGQAIAGAVTDLALPPGVFSLIYGPGSTVGQALASHPLVKAVAFTGSQGAGTALMATAAARPEPIPVYAEMSSINPVIVLPDAATTNPADVAAGFVASLTLGAGQFCTNPGLVFIPSDGNEFTREVRDRIGAEIGQTMLTKGIRAAYDEGLARLEANGARMLGAGRAPEGCNAPAPAVLTTTSKALRADPTFQEEVFGAAALLVTYVDIDDLIATLEQLQGQLTISIQSTPQDAATIARLLPILERKAGRIIANGWPTGVEVTHAMVHGGPFPATSDSRTTSVGTLAIHRFQRPVSYQNFDEALLPPAVQRANPWSLPRRVNGVLSNRETS